MKSSITALILSLFFVLGLTACGMNGLSVLDSIGSEDEVTPTGLTISTLISGSYSDFNSVTRNYQMIKLEHGTSSPTYAQWIPNASSTTAGAVLIFLPYQGINWSDLTIDATWFAKGAGLHPDEDEPTYDPFSSSDIDYTFITPQAAAAEGAFYSTNGLHVLIVYGRFYTGGSAQNDIDDVKNGLRFLQDQALVDKTNIGIYGSAYGAAGALYSVAQLGASFMPKAISLVSPESDFKKMVDYINVTLPSETVDQDVLRDYNSYFDPFYRRLNTATSALTGSPTRYDAYKQSQLAGITSNIFVAHDDWDTMVPVGNTTDLLTTLTLGDETYFLQRHTTGIDRDAFTVSHSQAGLEAMNADAVQAWSNTFLITQLTDSTAPRTSYYSSVALTAQLAYVISKNAASNSTFYNKVLGLLCKTNLQMVDTDAVNADMSGEDLLMTVMNVPYPGWAASGSAACTKLTATPPF